MLENSILNTTASSTKSGQSDNNAIQLQTVFILFGITMALLWIGTGVVSAGFNWIAGNANKKQKVTDKRLRALEEALYKEVKDPGYQEPEDSRTLSEHRDEELPEENITGGPSEEPTPDNIHKKGLCLPPESSTSKSVAQSLPTPYLSNGPIKKHPHPDIIDPQKLTSITEASMHPTPPGKCSFDDVVKPNPNELLPQMHLTRALDPTKQEASEGFVDLTKKGSGLPAVAYSTYSTIKKSGHESSKKPEEEMVDKLPPTENVKKPEDTYPKTTLPHTQLKKTFSSGKPPCSEQEIFNTRF